MGTSHAWVGIMNFEKITSWNKTLWIVVVIIWSIVGVQWVAENIDPETGHRIGQTNEI